MSADFTRLVRADVRSNKKSQNPIPDPQRGSVLVLVMTILGALFAGGGVAMFVTLQGTKAISYHSTSLKAMYCAEAGLQVSHQQIAAYSSKWGDLLDQDPSNDPDWYPLRPDIDGDATPDVTVWVEDNGDEVAPTANDPTVDTDGTILVISECNKYSESPVRVVEMVRFQGGSTSFRMQNRGGSSRTSNKN